MNAQAPKDFRLVGTRPVRPDGAEKVTGKAIYGPDFTIAGMLHGAILRSPHPHARILRIDTRKAEALPGVKAVVTGHDFPTLASLTMALGETSADIVYVQRNVMALEKVLYDGHAVAAVAATTAAIAEAAAALIEVDYEVLPHVIGIEEAMAPGAPLLHDDMFTKGLAETPTTPSNVSMRFQLAAGDAANAIDSAHAVVSQRYTTQPVHQGYIEPHACVASWLADGQSQIWASSQGAFMIRSLTAALLGLSVADIRVTPLEIGGGFGGKTVVYLEPVALLLSRKAGRPVRLTMNRADVFRASGPAPGSIIDIRLGASADGTLVGAEVEFKYGGGAFPGADVHSGAMSALASYRPATYRITGWGVHANHANIASYRAPGAPQVTFAVESALDELAQKLGMDPIELRLKNAVVPGDTTQMGTRLGQVGLVECLEAAKAHPHYRASLGPNQGRGIAAGTWGNYGGPSTASVSLGEDGSINVITGGADIGGSRASLAIMAAETLGIAYEKVRVVIADTSSTGYSMLAGGSRTTFATGKAVHEAATGVIAILKQRAAQIWGVDPAEVEWRDGAAFCLAQGREAESLPIGKIAAKANNSGGPITVSTSLSAAGWLPGYGVHICDTELDPETGQLAITRYTVVQDVGRAIHPDYVEGQMQGGAAQGIGWALNEAYIFGEDGRISNAGFLDYRMPVASDLPMIDTVMVEKPNPDHPYGVKGVGEVGIVPPLAAVAIAASAAAGLRLRDLPLAPDRVFAALQAKAPE